MKISPIIFSIFLLFSVTHAQNKTIDFAELEKTIEAEIKEAKTPGAAVAVISGDKIVFTKGFGATNAENGNAVNAGELKALRRKIRARAADLGGFRERRKIVF